MATIVPNGTMGQVIVEKRHRNLLVKLPIAPSLGSSPPVVFEVSLFVFSAGFEGVGLSPSSDVCPPYESGVDPESNAVVSPSCTS